MKKIYNFIKENPKEFIAILKEHFNSGEYIANSHWEEFDGEKHLMYFEKEDDCGEEIWFTFEDDLEGSTTMRMGMNIKKANGLLKFKGYVFPYRLDYDWND